MLALKVDVSGKAFGGFALCPRYATFVIGNVESVNEWFTGPVG